MEQTQGKRLRRLLVRLALAGLAIYFVVEVFRGVEAVIARAGDLAR